MKRFVMIWLVWTFEVGQYTLAVAQIVPNTSASSTIRTYQKTNWLPAKQYPSTSDILDSLSTASLRFLPQKFRLQPTSLEWVYQRSGASIYNTNLPDSSLTTLTIQAIYLRYTRTSNNDIQRSMSLHVRPTQVPDIRIEYQDTLLPTQALLLQTYTHPFLHADIPPPEESLAEKIVEPALIIGGAIASLLLFFFLRTQ